MRYRLSSKASASSLLGATLAIALVALLASPASAEPRQSAGVIPTQPAPAQTQAPTPKKPETPSDNSIMAPPLPGYALMFVLGLAVLALNLWSSKRTQID